MCVYRGREEKKGERARRREREREGGREVEREREERGKESECCTWVAVVKYSGDGI